MPTHYGGNLRQQAAMAMQQALQTKAQKDADRARRQQEEAGEMAGWTTLAGVGLGALTGGLGYLPGVAAGLAGVSAGAGLGGLVGGTGGHLVQAAHPGGSSGVQNVAQAAQLAVSTLDRYERLAKSPEAWGRLDRQMRGGGITFGGEPALGGSMASPLSVPYGTLGS